MFLVQVLNVICAMVLQKHELIHLTMCQMFLGVFSWDTSTSNTYLRHSEPGQALFFFFFSPCLNLICVEIKLVRMMIFKVNSNKGNVGYWVTYLFRIVLCD